MTIQLIGTVEEIQETKTYPKKEGEGNVDITKMKIDGKYFTCFSKSQLEGVSVGSKVDVTYTEKENTYEGKKYINNNISVLKLFDPTQQILSPETQAAIAATLKVMTETKTNATHPEFAQKVKTTLKGDNLITVGEKVYKVTLEEIK